MLRHDSKVHTFVSLAQIMLFSSFTHEVDSINDYIIDKLNIHLYYIAFN